MRRGTRVAAGRARNPAREGNDGRLMQRVGGGRQDWPHPIVGSPPADRNVAISVRGSGRRSTRPIYRPPTVAAPTRYAPTATNAPVRGPYMMRDQGAVWHPGCRMYPRMTAPVDADGFGASAREAALAAQLVDVRRKARYEYQYWRFRMGEKESEALAYRQRAEEAERDLTLVRDELAREQMASDAMAAIVREKTKLLSGEQERSEALKRLVDTVLKERADLNAWADEPSRGRHAVDRLHPDGGAVGPPRQAEMQDRCSPGLLRQIFLEQRTRDCSCMREMAANGLTNPHERFQDLATIGKGGFGTVHRGLCRKTKKAFAIKTIKPGNEAACLRREMIAYVMMGSHANIISIACLSDIAGSEGLVMEMAVCDMFKASTGKSDPVFTLAQQLNFQADATEGLQHMHNLGLVHCDVKVENTLICRSDGPSGFIAKVIDPGLWCGLGETRRMKTGTLGWTPLENVLGEVEAAPNQDTFSVAVDLLFILAHPTWKTEVVSLWAHSNLMTAGEMERLQVLRAEGGDENQLRAEVTERTMSDGSLPRIFLQPGNFDLALPPSEVLKMCKVLAKTVSRNPMDRPDMPALTTFLRDLASKTAIHEKTLAAVPRGLGLPPAIAAPPVLAPLPGLAAPPGFDVPPGLGLPAPAMPVVVGGGDPDEDLIPVADVSRGWDSTVFHASGSPAAGLVGADDGRGGNGNGTGGGGGGGGGSGSIGRGGFGGGRAQQEVVADVGGPNTHLTFSRVLARGFGTSPPDDDAATPPQAAAPRLRVGGRPPTPLTVEQVLARDFAKSTSANGAATPPVVPPAEVSEPS